MGDDHYAQLVKTYNELKSVRNSQLMSILRHLLPSSSELLRPSEVKCEQLLATWAAGSRHALVTELTKRVSESCNEVVHVHGCHGSGKSSLLANFTRQGCDALKVADDVAAGTKASGVVLLRHFFIRNDSAASVEIAVCVCARAHLSRTHTCQYMSTDCNHLCAVMGKRVLLSEPRRAPAHRPPHPGCPHGL